MVSDTQRSVLKVYARRVRDARRAHPGITEPVAGNPDQTVSAVLAALRAG